MFQAQYTFPSYERGWRRFPRLPIAEWAAGVQAQPAPYIIALDCEMCATTKSDKELIKTVAVGPNEEVGRGSISPHVPNLRICTL
jgi:hypothetical protein